MELLVIRHGESVADIEKRHEGRADFPLTDRGRAQARLAADWIAQHYPPRMLVASPLRRAAETAQIIGAHLDIPVDFDDGLMEMGNGVLAGLTFEEARRRYPRPEAGFLPHQAPEGGESQIEFRCRIESFWSRFCSSLPADIERVGIVTHGGVIHMLFRALLRLPVDQNIRFATGDTGMHLLRLQDESCTVLFANRLDHLAGGDY